MESKAIEHLEMALGRANLTFGNAWSEGFNIWKKSLGPLLGFVLIYMAISTVLGLIPYVGGAVNNLIFVPVLTLGAYNYCHNSLRQREEFGDFFKGFQMLPNILLLMLLTTIIYLVLALPVVLSFGIENIMGLITQEEGMASLILEDFDWTILVMFIPVVIATILFSFGLPMMWFYKLSPLNAIKYSAKFVFNNILTILGLAIVTMLFALSGIIALFIGFFVTLSIFYTVPYAAFSQATDLHGYLDETNDLDISDHLVGEV